MVLGVPVSSMVLDVSGGFVVVAEVVIVAVTFINHCK